MSYRLIGITLTTGNEYPMRCPTPDQASDILQSKTWEAWFEDAGLTYRIGDEAQLGEATKAIVCKWSHPDYDQDLYFSFQTFDNHYRETDIKRFVRQKLQWMVEDDDRGYDSLNTG
jgi:hypothetical protein